MHLIGREPATGTQPGAWRRQSRGAPRPGPTLTLPTPPPPCQIQAGKWYQEWEFPCPPARDWQRDMEEVPLPRP